MSKSNSIYSPKFRHNRQIIRFNIIRPKSNKKKIKFVLPNAGEKIIVLAENNKTIMIQKRERTLVVPKSATNNEHPSIQNEIFN